MLIFGGLLKNTRIYVFNICIAKNENKDLHINY